MMKRIPLFLLTAFLAGCVSLSTESYRRPVSLGMKADSVRARLGPPKEVDAYPSGERWTYDFQYECSYASDCTYRWREVTLFVRGDTLYQAHDMPGKYIIPSR